MKSPCRFVSCAWLLAAAVAAQTPVKVPLPPNPNGDLKTAPEPFPKLDPPVQLPIQVRAPRTDRPATGMVDTDSVVTSPALPGGILHDRVGDTLWSIGHTYKASFDRHGATFIPYFAGAEHNHPLAFRVSAVRVGPSDLALRETMPKRDGDTVEFDHGALRAIYELLGDRVAAHVLEHRRRHPRSAGAMGRSGDRAVDRCRRCQRRGDVPARQHRDRRSQRPAALPVRPPERQSRHARRDDSLIASPARAPRRAVTDARSGR